MEIVSLIFKNLPAVLQGDKGRYNLSYLLVVQEEGAPFLGTPK